MRDLLHQLETTAGELQAQVAGKEGDAQRLAAEQEAQAGGEVKRLFTLTDSLATQCVPWPGVCGQRGLHPGYFTLLQQRAPGCSGHTVSAQQGLLPPSTWRRCDVLQAMLRLRSLLDCNPAL